jgi:hypothetical protein
MLLKPYLSSRITVNKNVSAKQLNNAHSGGQNDGK